MKIASWNVNSIKARLPAVIAWLGAAAPDVLALQEIKCAADAFPFHDIEAAGYCATVLGQKTYNGVALLSKTAPEAVREGLPGDDGGDGQARYVEGVFDGVRVASIYLPNGNPAASDKFAYKLSWMARLQRHAGRLLADDRFLEPILNSLKMATLATAANLAFALAAGWLLIQRKLLHTDNLWMPLKN